MLIAALLFGICIGMSIKLKIRHKENCNLKKDLQSKEALINRLLDIYEEQGLIDAYERQEYEG